MRGAPRVCRVPSDLIRIRLQNDVWVTISADVYRLGAQKDNPAEPNYDPEAHSGEGPVRAVSLAEYQISRFPTTVKESRTASVDP
jgi:hypothetical protein